MDEVALITKKYDPHLLYNFSQVTKTSILSEYLSEPYSRYMAFPNNEDCLQCRRRPVGGVK